MRDMMFGQRSSMPGMPGMDQRAPTLVNPAAAQNQAGICPGYNMGMIAQGTDLASQLTPQVILAHYAKQLADSGWKAGPPSASSYWTRTDTSGVAYEYQITVQAYPDVPMCRKVVVDLNGRTPR
jgi:hypothetical protein